MKYAIILLITSLVVLSACAVTPETPTTPQVETPNSGDEEFMTVQFTVEGTQECVGVAPQTCLVTSDGLFYESIEGFSYEQGYTYQIVVEKIPRDPVPQDANAHQFVLVEILSQEEKPFSCTTEEQAATVCTEQYAPVCGENGETYSNDCFACASGEVINYEPGVCEADGQTICEDANGTWIAEHSECEYIGEDFCDLYGGEFDACASACRHEEQPAVCTKQCVPVCILA